MLTANGRLDIALNDLRLTLLGEGSRAHALGLEQENNPYIPETEYFDWWLFGWTYARLVLLERN
jgi:hypothetical protein